MKTIKDGNQRQKDKIKWAINAQYYFISNNLAVLESEEFTRLQWLFSSLSSACMSVFIEYVCGLIQHML